MGLYCFRLPDIGEGVAEAEITVWHVKLGDQIREDQALLDVMTDKATVDLSSPVEGRVVALHGEVGAMAPVGSVLVEIDTAGEAPSTEDTTAVAIPTEQPKPQTIQGQSADARAEPTEPVAWRNPDPTASPATRRRAMEWGISLADVLGTGPNGRILTEDLERHRDATVKPRNTTARAGDEEIHVVGLRRKIAEKMALSKRHIPHFSYVEEFDLTELESLRAELNGARSADQPKLTLLPFFMRAIVKLVAQFPNVNAHYDEDAGVLKRFVAVHIGIAAQTAQGLMVPVVRHAESRDLWDCARELARVTAAVRGGNASRELLTGSTITLTSLGPLGGIAATPIINHPETAIIGPNKLVERAVVDGSFITRRRLMNLSSSFDHRIVDGYDAASFVHQLKRLLEHPALLFMD